MRSLSTIGITYLKVIKQMVLEVNEMPIFFNNCKGRKHSELYGDGAFYDLDRTGRYATVPNDLRKGDVCVVATPESSCVIDFSWFAFSNEQVLPDEDGTNCSVLFGERIRSEKLPKIKAAETEPYSVFFNVKGDFKRQSVISA